VAIGVVLLTLTAVYAAQVASVVQETRDILANPLPEWHRDGAMQFDLRTAAIHHFYFTSQAWGLAHLWLLWVLVVRFRRHPERRAGLVRTLAAVLSCLIVMIWFMVVWLGRHGTSV
jgi:hypothetical protein